MSDDVETIEVGSGNVFADLGFDADEVEDLTARSKCVRRIARIKEQRGWTQSELGEAIGMKQSEVSLLLGGKISRFSLGRLLHALKALGVGVRITLIEEAEAHFVLDDRIDS